VPGRLQVCQWSKAQNSGIQHFQMCDISKQGKRFGRCNRRRELIDLLTFVALPPAIASE
jgi:hypothetical protein